MNNPLKDFLDRWRVGDEEGRRRGTRTLTWSTRADKLVYGVVGAYKFFFAVGLGVVDDR